VDDIGFISFWTRLSDDCVLSLALPDDALLAGGAANAGALHNSKDARAAARRVDFMDDSRLV
jgi:hypothetical protein